MVSRRKVLVCLQLIVALLMLWAAAPAAADSVMPENKVPGTIESRARRLTHQLEKQGYEVARGYFRLYTQEDCDSSFAIMGTCYANNPAAPYVFAVLPTWQDEWLDPKMVGVFGPTHEGYSPTYRLDPREAIVILGQLPPPAKYFGLQTNVFTRQGEFDQTSHQYKTISAFPADIFGMFFSYVPWDHGRIQLLSSVGNSINNAVIQNGSSAAFDQERFFIITPDKFMDQAVRGAFNDIQVESKDIFTEPISSLLRVGLDEPADDFYTLLRYAMPDDMADRRPRSAAWRADLPLVVLRVRDPRTERQPLPYAPVQLDERAAMHDPAETDLLPDLVKLAKAVCQKWGQPCDDPEAYSQRVLPFRNVQPSPILMVGPECIPVGMNCLADTLDTVYHFSVKLPLDDRRVYAVVGALSTQTGNATYVGLGVNDAIRQLGIDNVSDGPLTGSAGDYGSVVAEPDKFFVYYFTRDCANLAPWAAGYCRSIPDSALSDPDRLMFSLRDYMFPDTERGPAAEFTLSPRVIALQAP